MFGIDKWKAVHGKWRIREVTLLSLSFFGGSIGGWLAMRIFHHKTQKLCFSIGLPLMLIAHLILIVYYMFSK